MMIIRDSLSASFWPW